MRLSKFTHEQHCEALGWAVGRVFALRADRQDAQPEQVIADASAEHEEEMCPCCYGRGEWQTECCDGSYGCSCRGQVIDMGTCLACGGSGVRMDGMDTQANIRSISGQAYIGTGPRWR
jgi:hypothetical protein